MQLNDTVDAIFVIKVRKTETLKYPLNMMFAPQVNRLTTFSGCYTAIATPMTNLRDVDYEGLRSFVEFQVREGVQGILAVGTTGESPTLDWNEHNKVIERTKEYAGEKVVTIAGTGSNSTQETIEATAHAQHIGIRNILLVDPYYNGPSSMEIRREYVEPVARQFPEMKVIPYIIPGRTGTQLLPQDLAILHERYPNVRTVKEATGDLENMKLTRRLCGADFDILSGDDDKTFAMMTTPEIAASGVISVTSNIAPRAVAALSHFILDGKINEATRTCTGASTALQHRHRQNHRANQLWLRHLQGAESVAVQDTHEHPWHALRSMQTSTRKNDPSWSRHYPSRGEESL